jgi:hypothetical protein
VGVALAVVLSVAVASPRASASQVAVRQAVAVFLSSGDGSGSVGHISIHNGNGKHNINTATILSPTVNRGGLQVANTNTGGKTVTKLIAKRNKFCCSRRHRRR